MLHFYPMCIVRYSVCCRPLFVLMVFFLPIFYVSCLFAVTFYLLLSILHFIYYFTYYFLSVTFYITFYLLLSILLFIYYFPYYFLCYFPSFGITFYLLLTIITFVCLFPCYHFPVTFPSFFPTSSLTPLQPSPSPPPHPACVSGLPTIGDLGQIRQFWFLSAMMDVF